jgi:hypothetical protein
MSAAAAIPTRFITALAPPQPAATLEASAPLKRRSGRSDLIMIIAATF